MFRVTGMIKEIQSYRICFSSFLVWMTLVTTPPFLGLYLLTFGNFQAWDIFLALYQLLLGLNLLFSGAMVYFFKWEILPRGITGPISPGQRRYIPFSGITEVQRFPNPLLPLIRIRNEANQSVFLPTILGRQQEFEAILDGILPRQNPLRASLKPNKPWKPQEPFQEDSSR